VWTDLRAYLVTYLTTVEDQTEGTAAGAGTVVSGLNPEQEQASLDMFQVRQSLNRIFISIYFTLPSIIACIT